MTTLRSPAQLCDHGLAPPEQHAALDSVAARYAVALPQALADLIDPNDAHDPIARQFMPDVAELKTQPQELSDPIGDDAHSPVEGVVHRYPDRVLLKLTPICAVYCRFCFRREMVGPENGKALSAAALNAALDYIRSRPQIWEVILTGGDPLVLSPRRLREIMARLGAIEHVKIVRLHTRVPVADPDLVSDALVAAMTSSGKTTYIALHANHARELTDAALAACARITDAGVPMLGQTVLLAGVNDDAETLAELMRAFVEARIKPYYLHHPDLAPGTGHFRVSLAKGQSLVKALRGRLSGLCQPTYVLDIPGGHGKVPIGPSYLNGNLDACVRVEDPWGHEHAYPPASSLDGAGPRNPSATR
ncbi:MAG TPA: lysine-2,3-aminomutase-like protein [Pseudolabrys sp.]